MKNSIIKFQLALLLTIGVQMAITANAQYRGMNRGMYGERGMRMGMNRGMGMGMNRPMYQGPRDSQQHEKFEQRLQEFSKRLNLTADQQNKVRDIMKQSRMEAKSIIQNNSNKEDRRPKMMQLALKTDGQIMNLLDPKQQEIYKQIKAERKEKRQGQMKEQKEMRMEMDDAGIL